MLKGTSTNLSAVLDVIAWCEGTSTIRGTKNNGYDVIVTGIDKTAEFFSDFSAHPFANGRKSKAINSRGLTSNASGRYQFMLKDYQHYKALLKLPDFGPDSQDKWAIQLIKERGALPLIEAGKITDAIKRISNLWASLPGAGYSQPERAMSDVIKMYVKFGGKLSE